MKRFIACRLECSPLSLYKKSETSQEYLPYCVEITPRSLVKKSQNINLEIDFRVADFKRFCSPLQDGHSSVCIGPCFQSLQTFWQLHFSCLMSVVTVVEIQKVLNGHFYANEDTERIFLLATHQ